MHKAVSLLCLQSINLPAPFGICDDNKVLHYYNDSSSYSVSKCHLECQADSLNASCGCKDAHMPGILRCCQSGLDAKILASASASKLWPRP